MRDVEQAFDEHAEARRALKKLTEKVPVGWSRGREVTYGPLLEELRLARYPNLGRTKGGSGASDPIDMKAVTLYEHIDGVVRSRLNDLRQHSTGELIPLTKQLFEAFKAEDAGGRLEDGERLFALFTQWVSQIEDLFDPPKEYELTADCPECATGHVADADGGLKWSVRVRVKIGRALVAECHACQKMWVGQADLTDLAESMDVEVDWVKLRELTSDTPERVTRL